MTRQSPASGQALTKAAAQGICKETSGGGCSQGNAGTCGSITNQFWETIPSSSPGSVMCNKWEQVSMCKQVNGQPGCYEWEFVDCLHCCWLGACKSQWQECE